MSPDKHHPASGTSIEDAELRRAFASLARESRGDEDCPPPDELWAAISAELDPESRGRLLDHTMSCPSCAELWRMARDLGARPPVPGRRDRGRLLGWPPLVGQLATGAGTSMGLLLEHRAGLITAMAACLAVVVFLSPPGLLESPHPIYRQVTAHRDAIEAVPGHGETGSGGVELRWTSPPDAILYDLKIMTAGLEPVVMVEGLESESYLLGPEQLSDVAAGETLFWRVEAILESGERMTSATFVLELP